MKISYICFSIFAVLFCQTVVAQVLDPDPDPDPYTKEQAHDALASIGANVEGTTLRCAGCHGLNLISLRKWGERANRTLWVCLNDEEGESRLPRSARTPEDKINCLRENPEDPESDFEVKKLGLLAAGAHTSYFKELFQKAFPEDWENQHQIFQQQVQMPHNGNNLMPEDQFANVLLWQKENLAFIEELIGDPGDAPTTCQEHVSDDLKTHVQSMALHGWGVRNNAAGIKMFACGPGIEGRDCFKQTRSDGAVVFPRNDSQIISAHWDDDMPEASLRIIEELDFKPSYWMRASADGRFVAYGSGGVPRDENDETHYSRVADLWSKLDLTSERPFVSVSGHFDPSFFPDNSGFMMQGNTTGICNQSILEDESITHIDFSEADCSKNEINLYQSVGASLEGNDYLAVSGAFNGDSDFERYTTPYWLHTSYLMVYPVIHTGQVFEAQPANWLYTPYLADWGMSHSTKLLVSRISGLSEFGGLKQQGYQISKIAATSDPQNPFELQDMGTFCSEGAKANFSYGERFIVYNKPVLASEFAEYGFNSPDDPRFGSLVGSSNIYIFDILTGKKKRVTRMGHDQRAKFPNFRSDGWLYFLVFDNNVGKHFLMASDAALLIQ